VKPDIPAMERVYRITGWCMKSSPIGLALAIAWPVWSDWQAGEAFDVDNILIALAEFAFALFVLHWMRTSIRLAQVRARKDQMGDAP
jgi:uncharacterized membrane protein